MNVRTSDPNDLFDGLGENVTMDKGLVAKVGNMRFVSSCEHYQNVKINDACVTFELTEEHWTDFFNVDSPSALTGGDNESIANIRSHGINVCDGATPIRAVCQLKGVKFSKFAQDCNDGPDTLYTFCSPEHGLVCLNSEQGTGQMCHDYEIQFLCPSVLIPSTVMGELAEDVKNITAISELQPINLILKHSKQTVKVRFIIMKNGKWFRICFTSKSITYNLDCQQDGSIRQYYVVRLNGIAIRGTERERFHAVLWVNAKNLQILRFWFESDIAIETTKNIGGNTKIGEYYFGDSAFLPPLTVTSLTGSLDCLLMTGDVTTVDNGGSDSTTKSEPHKYNCAQGNFKEVNGAFSPLNDAHGHATHAIEQLKAKFGPEPFTNCLPLTLLVHYSGNCDGAWWNHVEKRALFCDGNEFFPLSSDLNVVVHEIFHCVVIERSQLSYDGEPGCIHESLADISAEWVEFSLAGTVDWLVGGSVTKPPRLGIRHFKTPSIDGLSIDNVAQYTTGMDIHHCSGLYNRAFYLLATTPGWDINNAYFVFFQANFGLFKRCTTLRGGVCHLENSATSLGFNKADVTNAFFFVGLSCLEDSPLQCA